MRSDKSILLAFLLNLLFSVIELVGGAFTNSVAIVSDAVHDMGDALSIGIAYFLERKSKKQADLNYTYGYARYSVIGSVITTLILMLGSAFVIYNSVVRIINPVEIHYNGMIILAVAGVLINLLAAYFTKSGDSLNQKTVNLHMLEDVLGWVVVLVGAVVMRFAELPIIDPIMSICVAAFIMYQAFKNLKEALELFLERTPRGIQINEIKAHILALEGVAGVHHIHIWSIDGNSNFATMHVVIKGGAEDIKHKVKEELMEHGIAHATLELEAEGEACLEESCAVASSCKPHGHHHHHHH